MTKILLFFSIFFLASCSSSSKKTPEITFYILDDLPVAAKVKSGQEIKVATVKVADYLNKPGLITRYSERKLLSASYHNWAEELPKLINRALKSKLNQLNSSRSFTHRCDSCATLSLNVEHFYPTDDGRVVFAGSYQMADTQGRSSSSTPFNYIETLKADGYAQSVAQLSDLISRLAGDITASLDRQVK